MIFYSTSNSNYTVPLRDALFSGSAPGNGLFFPSNIQKLPERALQEIHSNSKYPLSEMYFEVMKTLLTDSLPDTVLRYLLSNAINFPFPLIHLEKRIYALELFHGPTFAFKDVGARTLAELIAYYLTEEENEKKTRNTQLKIVVATSGDTGGAVAASFFQKPGITVYILYPSGKVSELQEKQLTTLGGNIHALEVEGTFDDCQALAKQAVNDSELCQSMHITSANSINIGRLLPQTLYYFAAYKSLMNALHSNSPSALKKTDLPKIVFSVPSGNFGNLTAGLLAQRMGLKIHRFIAATNSNDTIPRYLQSGDFDPRPSIQTISNAMDVGNPNNFARLLELSNKNWRMMKEEIQGVAYSDDQTKEAIKDLYDRTGYVVDPHGAIGYRALKELLEDDELGIFLHTAHPGKFPDAVRQILDDTALQVPEAMSSLLKKPKIALKIPNNYEIFRNIIKES
jgi:threonine synthase